MVVREGIADYIGIGFMYGTSNKKLDCGKKVVDVRVAGCAAGDR